MARAYILGSNFRQHQTPPHSAALTHCNNNNILRKKKNCKCTLHINVFWVFVPVKYRPTIIVTLKKYIYFMLYLKLCFNIF